jgi:hypothetical protein
VNAFQNPIVWLKKWSLNISCNNIVADVYAKTALLRIQQNETSYVEFREWKGELLKGHEALLNIHFPWYVIGSWELLCRQFELESSRILSYVLRHIFDQKWYACSCNFRDWCNPNILVSVLYTSDILTLCFTEDNWIFVSSTMCIHLANLFPNEHYDACYSFSQFISWISAKAYDYTLPSYHSPASFWPCFHTHLAVNFMIMNCCQKIFSFIMKVVLCIYRLESYEVRKRKWMILMLLGDCIKFCHQFRK